MTSVKDRRMAAAIIIGMLIAMILCIPSEVFAGTKVEKDKYFDNAFYVYGGKKFRATCVIDEMTMPYYQATIEAETEEELNKTISTQKNAAKRWLQKNTKAKHTYRIKFKRYDRKKKKWKSLSSHTIKKTYKRKIRIKVNKKTSTKAVVYGTISYTGKDEKFFNTKKFKKNTKYVENNTGNEAFYFTKNGKFHWEKSSDDNE